MVTVLQRWSLPLDVKIRATKLKTCCIQLWGLNRQSTTGVLVPACSLADPHLHFYLGQLWFLYLFVASAQLYEILLKWLIGSCRWIAVNVFLNSQFRFSEPLQKKKQFLSEGTIIVSNLRFGILRFVFVIAKSLFTVDSNW